MAGLEVGVLPLRWPLNQRMATLRILTPDPELGWRGMIQSMEHRETQGQRGQAACLMPHSFSGLGWEQVPRAQDVELSPESSFLSYSICGMGPIAPCSRAGRGLAVVSGVPASLTPASCLGFQGPEAKPHLSIIGGLHEYWELGEGRTSMGVSFLPSEDSLWRILGLRNGCQNLGFLDQRNLLQNPLPPLPFPA